MQKNNNVTFHIAAMLNIISKMMSYNTRLSDKSKYQCISGLNYVNGGKDENQK